MAGWLDKYQDGGEVDAISGAAPKYWQIPIKGREDFRGNLLSGIANKAAAKDNFLSILSKDINTKGGVNRESAYGDVYDLYRYYFGQNPKSDILHYSKYKPSISKDKNSKYISINDAEFRNQVLDIYNQLSFKEKNKPSTNVSGYMSNYKGLDPIGIWLGIYPENRLEEARKARSKTTAIGNFKIGKGVDEKGDYISYYDLFDAGTGNEKVPLLGTAKPFEIYDRIYVDKDSTGRYVPREEFKNGGKVKYQDGGRSIPNRNAPSNDTYDRIRPLLMVAKNIKPAWGDDIGDFLYDMKSSRYRSIRPDSYGIQNALDEQDRLKNLKGDIKINDIRNVASNRKMSHNVNSETVRKLVKASIEKGLDPNTVLAIALQETGISNINPLHQVDKGYIPKTIEDADLINKNINFLSDKIKYAEKLGKTQEADIIQAWNGYGKMRPGYYGRKDTIDMDKDPVYGNRIVALRDSAILTTPEIQNIIKEEKVNFKDGGTLTSSKAKEILRDGQAHGKPLTPKQKRYMELVAGGKYQDGGEIEGKELPEVTVYGKKQYKDELKKQMDKYLADMAKYKQDSTQWIKANQAYRDSLNVYNGAINNWEEEIKEQQEFDDKRIKELIDSPYFKSEEKERQREYLEQGRKRYLDYDDVMKESHYSIPNTNTLTPTEYGYHRVKGGGWPTNYPIGIDDYTVSILKDKSKVQPIGLTSTSEGGSHGIFKKPEKRYIPIKPDKPTGYTKINYDPTYENLRMKSLWANIAKQDTSQNIGSLENFTADPNYEKGFTIGEAVRQFPQEIKDQYNIDYIGNQVGIKKYKDGGEIKPYDDSFKANVGWVAGGRKAQGGDVMEGNEYKDQSMIDKTTQFFRKYPTPYHLLNKRIYNKIHATSGYPEHIDSMIDAFGSLLGKGDEPPKDSADQEIFGYSLGQVPLEKLKYWNTSKYKPQISKKKDYKYIAPVLTNKTKAQLVEHYINDYNPTGKDTSFIVEGFQGFAGLDNSYDPLANHKVGFNKDSLGKYMSIYDKFDFQNPLANFFLTKKPEIYDRYYYSENKDYTNKPPFELTQMYDSLNNRLSDIRNLRREYVLPWGKFHDKVYDSESNYSKEFLDITNDEINTRDRAELIKNEISNFRPPDKYIVKDPSEFKKGGFVDYDYEGQLKKPKQLRTFTNGWVDKYL